MTGMFGAHGTGDTSGYGLLVERKPLQQSSPRPYGGYFDAVVDRLQRLLATQFESAIDAVVVHRGQLTIHVTRSRLLEVARTLRDDTELRFELCAGASGVHHPGEAGRELRVVYPLMSITHNRRIQLEVACPDSDRHVPSLFAIYPTCDWHERETWDFFGIVFDGHPALTRIAMPDDWTGHPQRKDYQLGGVPVQFHGAEIPPPDTRRAYH